jgi:hypothetical protein
MILELPFFTSAKNNKTNYSLSYETFLDKIQYGHDVESIERDRKLRNTDKKLYDKNKVNRCCIMPNATISIIRSKENLLASTGLLFFDIDEKDIIENNFNESNIDLTKILNKYKSYSGKGITILVRVENLDINCSDEAFNQFYKFIASDIGIYDVYDRSAAQKSKLNFLSYDPNLYRNSNPFIYDFSELNYEVTYKEDPKRTNKKSNNNEITLQIDESQDFILSRYNDSQDFIEHDLVFQVYKEKVKTQSTIIYKNVPDGKKHNFLMLNASILWNLNPNSNTFSITCALKCIAKFGNIYHKMKNPELELNRIVKQAYKSDRSNIKLVKERSIIFNENIKLTLKEKQKITGKEMGKVRKERTSDIIEKIVLDYNLTEKMTAKTISNLSGLSLITIKRYWSNFKESANQYNISLKNK